MRSDNTYRRLETFYKMMRPIAQNPNTGKWGFRGKDGALDLEQCVYATKRKAELARHSAAIHYANTGFEPEPV
jgi:hypothetical protein